jgi:hypothetical protein
VCARQETHQQKRDDEDDCSGGLRKAQVTVILSLAVGHQKGVRPLPLLCPLHMIETVDASVILFHDNTESTRHDHYGVT